MVIGSPTTRSSPQECPAQIPPLSLKKALVLSSSDPVVHSRLSDSQLGDCTFESLVAWIVYHRDSKFFSFFLSFLSV